MPCEDAHLRLCQKGKLMAFIWVLISEQCAGPSARQPLPPLLQARPCYHHLTKFNRVLQLRTASTCSRLPKLPDMLSAKACSNCPRLHVHDDWACAGI